MWKKQCNHPMYHLCRTLLNSLLFFFSLHHLPNCQKILFQKSHVDLQGTYLSVIPFIQSNLPDHKSSQERKSSQDRSTTLQFISTPLPADASHTSPIEALQTIVRLYVSMKTLRTTVRLHSLYYHQ